jgi:hypothetical protein
MATENLLAAKDDWNDIFLARDVDGNEDEQSADESDSDYDDAQTAAMIYSDSDEDEIEVGPAIELQNTQVLRDQLQGKSLLGPIRHILTVMDGLGINLPIFLDALS